jgi:hypothetical protein
LLANDGDWSDQLEITMLRPADWLDAMGAAPGTWITLTQDGLEHQGHAKVLTIEDCPQIVDAPGTVVLSTIRRVSPAWMEIHVAGADAPIEVSLQHPFFMDEVDDWVFSGELQIGQQIKTRQGLVQIEQLVRHDAAREVFNLEIEETHTYYVASSEVLGHNCDMPAGGWGAKPKKLSSNNYPNPDPSMDVPPVRYVPKTRTELMNMRSGKRPTSQVTHGTNNIEYHHRQQKGIEHGNGVIDELTEWVHRRGGNHSRHNRASTIMDVQRQKEINKHIKMENRKQGAQYFMDGEGI